MQVFMCLVVSSLGLLFTFHVYSFKWVLISILIFEMVSWNIKTEKNLRSFLATEHIKLGFVKNCLNSITLWLANVTILLFTRTFATWYFCFSRKAKDIQHVEISKCGKNISDTLGYASCATFLFLPHFDVICDLLLNRRTATWNLFVKY